MRGPAACLRALQPESPVKRKLLLTLCSFVVALLLGEHLVRKFVPPKKFITIEDNADFMARLEEERANPVEFEYDIGCGTGFYLQTPMGLRMRANARVRIQAHRLHGRPIEIRTNGLGLRGPELGEKSDPRVLFLGDSIFFGEYMNEEDTIVGRVQALMADAQQPIEAVNGGLSAVGLQNEITLLNELGPLIQPDAVVLGFYLNDFQNSPGLRIWTLPESLGGSQLARLVASQIPGYLPRVNLEAVEPEDVKVWQAELEEAFPTTVPGPDQSFHQDIKKYTFDWGASFSERVWVRLDSLLREVHAICDRKGYQLLWVAFPSRQQVEHQNLIDFPQQQLKAIAQDLDIPVLDFLPLLREAVQTETDPLFLDQCHHTIRGNHLIAEWMQPFLAEHLKR